MSQDDKRGIHNLQMDELYIEALVEILVFAAQTAAYLAHKEVAAGRAGKDLIKLSRLANDSNDIIKFLKESIEIGEPTSNSIN
jgi:hypothetical protein